MLAILLLTTGCGSTPITPEDLEAVNGTRVESFLESAAAGAVWTFLGAGGRELAYVAYRESRRTGGTALVCLAGLPGHAGWLDEAARELRERGCGVFCLDHRGIGLNRENRGFAPGDVRTWQTLAEDVRLFVQALRERYRRVYILGVSWGGRLAMGFALDHQEEIDGIALIAPALVIRADLPIREETRRRVALPVRPAMLAASAEVRARILNDPLWLTYVTPRFVAESRDLGDRVREGAGTIGLPILALLAGDDRILDNEGTEAVIRQCTGPVETIVLEGAMHAIPLEDPERIATDVDLWLEGLR
jgi:lysophospholipase